LNNRVLNSSLNVSIQNAESKDSSKLAEICKQVFDSDSNLNALGLNFRVVIMITIIVASTIGGWWIVYSILSGQTSTDEVNWPTNGWLTSTPEEQGMNSTKLAQMIEFIEEQHLDIDSVIVIRNGYIVLEEYPNPVYGPDTKHKLWSATKSFTSALIGIAFQQGFIDGVDQEILCFFPDRMIVNLDQRKQHITIENLLTMSPGYQWSMGDGSRMRGSPDPIQYVLDKPMVHSPGSLYNYGDGASLLLSAIISEATGQTTLEFASEYLFDPLNITEVYWESKEDVYFAASGLHLTPRDMAKFGYLYLNNGTWDGKQIVSAAWVANSTEIHFRGPGYIAGNDAYIDGYGYQWWLMPQTGVYYAAGLYEQRIYVVPEKNLVMVFTANNRDVKITAGLMSRFIFPACTETLPEQYSKYGFSFNHPKGMTRREDGFKEESASEVSGMVQFRFEYPLEIVNVMWDTVASAPELVAVLEELIVWVERGGIEVNDRGSLFVSLKDGHEMVYQRFNVTEQGLPMTGIVGSWYCDKTARVYIFSYVTLPKFVIQQGLLAEFHRHLDSLFCH